MAYRQLTTEERYTIAALRTQGLGVDAIALQLKRHRSTIYREVSRNATPYDGAYRPSQATEKTNARRSRSRRNSRFNHDDFQQIADQVRQKLSPQQIVGRGRLLGKKVMSHESIYRRIWADKAAGGSLWRNLRCGCKKRRKRYRSKDSRGRLPGKKMIAERPKIVEERSRIGDWEIDTVHGSDKASVVTIVERKSGLVCIGKLSRATAQLTTQRTISLLQPHKDNIKTITSDNGSEFHMYKDIEQALGIQIYFATPHHAWERGTNENTNGLIRQYLPKGTSLSSLSQTQCNRIAEALNNRPRLRLNYHTPNEIYSNITPT
jgi:IS30 family transposase